MTQDVKLYLEALRENDPEWASFIGVLLNRSSKNLSLKELKQLAMSERFYHWEGLPVGETVDG